MRTSGTQPSLTLSLPKAVASWKASASWLSGAVWVIALLTMAAGAARAEDRPVRDAVDEAVSVHAIATAARLCKLITETDLTRAVNRMDRVHAMQLVAADQETYLILRSSDSFRNMVFASALRRAQGGCSPELAAVWRDVESTLVTADLNPPNLLADSGRRPSAR